MNPFQKNWSSEEEQPKLGIADITVVLDNSGSMESLKQGVCDGFNEFVLKMRKTPGDNRWTMVMFDDPDSAKGAGEQFPNVVCENRSERSVPILIAGSGAVGSGDIRETIGFKPRGNTALVDAVCLSIKRAEARTSGREDHTKMVMVVITDGQENRSQEYTSVQMREMIAAKQAKDWQFIYLGANQDAFVEAGKYNMAGGQGYVGAGNVASGAVGSGALSAFGYAATTAGIAQAIASGMVGASHVASGAVASGKINPDYNVEVK